MLPTMVTVLSAMVVAPCAEGGRRTDAGTDYLRDRRCTAGRLGIGKTQQLVADDIVSDTQRALRSSSGEAPPGAMTFMTA